MRRFLILLYGAASYAFFFVTFLYAVAFVSGIAVPKTIDKGPMVPIDEAFIVDMLLMTLFAVQPDIDETSGDLTYTPASGATGTATGSTKRKKARCAAFSRSYQISPPWRSMTSRKVSGEVSLPICMVSISHV